MRVAMALAGFTPGEADLLRRAMSRSRSAEAMAELRARFVAGALANGVEPTRRRRGRSGSCRGSPPMASANPTRPRFALIAYQTLWLKAHYPAEFYCALLNHQPMGFYSPEVVIGDVKRHGITVLRPDVNRSEDGCTLEDGAWMVVCLSASVCATSAVWARRGGRACWLREVSGRLPISPTSAVARDCRGRS